MNRLLGLHGNLYFKGNWKIEECDGESSTEVRFNCRLEMSESEVVRSCKQGQLNTICLAVQIA